MNETLRCVRAEFLKKQEKKEHVYTSGTVQSFSCLLVNTMFALPLAGSRTSTAEQGSMFPNNEYVRVTLQPLF